MHTNTTPSNDLVSNLLKDGFRLRWCGLSQRCIVGVFVCCRCVRVSGRISGSADPARSAVCFVYSKFHWSDTVTGQTRQSGGSLCGLYLRLCSKATEMESFIQRRENMRTVCWIIMTFSCRCELAYTCKYRRRATGHVRQQRFTGSF